MGERVRPFWVSALKLLVLLLFCFITYVLGLTDGMSHAKKITRETTVLETNTALKEVGSSYRIDDSDRYLKVYHIQKRKAVKKIEDRTESSSTSIDKEPKTRM